MTQDNSAPNDREPSEVPCVKCGGTLKKVIVDHSLDDKPLWWRHYYHKPTKNCWHSLKPIRIKQSKEAKP